jgi:hypothetical protein
MADFLEANGMDEDLAKTVASTTNAKIKAKKAKKEEKTKAIESTAQTALAVTALVVTGWGSSTGGGSNVYGIDRSECCCGGSECGYDYTAAATTAATVASTAASFTSTIVSAISTGISTLGAVVTGTASVGNYVQVAKYRITSSDWF